MLKLCFKAQALPGSNGPHGITRKHDALVMMRQHLGSCGHSGTMRSLGVAFATMRPCMKNLQGDGYDEIVNLCSHPAPRAGCAYQAILMLVALGLLGPLLASRLGVESIEAFWKAYPSASTTKLTMAEGFRSAPASDFTAINLSCLELTSYRHSRICSLSVLKAGNVF